jgi:cell division septation protein DedD
LASTPATSPAYPSILYTRATLATNADSAEIDYRRVIVEYAASPQASDALLRLAQLELARGDRQQAAAHLGRLMREQLPNQMGIGFARTQLQVGLAYFDLQDTVHACAALIAAGVAVPASDVELRNRIDYNTKRCPKPGAGGATTTASADSGRKGAPAGSRGADSAAKTTAARGAAATPKPANRSGAPTGPAAAASATPRRVRPGFTVQVAAYQTVNAAQALVDHLNTRGFVARIYGTAPPFRVRVGRFATENQADSAARSLKRKGVTGFVTPAETSE